MNQKEGEIMEKHAFLDPILRGGGGITHPLLFAIDSKVVLEDFIIDGIIREKL